MGGSASPGNPASRRGKLAPAASSPVQQSLSTSGNVGLVLERGFFYGYTPMTWACIIMNAGGGLLVGTVIKYADAVTKDVAIGASIVFSSIASTQLFGFEISTAFVVGCFMVIYSVFLYGERATCCGLLAKS